MISGSGSGLICIYFSGRWHFYRDESLNYNRCGFKAGGFSIDCLGCTVYG